MTDHQQIRLTRTFTFRVERVFSAFWEPRDLEKWIWGSIGRNCQAEVDFKLGGPFVVTTERPDGAVWSLYGAYLELNSESRIKFSLAWNAPMGYEPASELVTIDFVADNECTIVSFLHEGDFSVKSKEVHEEGWINVFDALEKHLASDRS